MSVDRRKLARYALSFSSATAELGFDVIDSDDSCMTSKSDTSSQIRAIGILSTTDLTLLPDTRFRDIEQHQLKLDIFPSLSIGPEVHPLLYKNASTTLLLGRFLRQDTVMMKAQFSFDHCNARKLRDQIEYLPPAPSK